MRARERGSFYPFELKMEYTWSFMEHKHVILIFKHMELKIAKLNKVYAARWGSLLFHNAIMIEVWLVFDPCALHHIDDRLEYLSKTYRGASI